MIDTVSGFNSSLSLPLGYLLIWEGGILNAIYIYIYIYLEVTWCFFFYLIWKTLVSFRFLVWVNYFPYFLGIISVFFLHFIKLPSMILKSLLSSSPISSYWKSFTALLGNFLFLWFMFFFYIDIWLLEVRTYSSFLW